MVARRSPALDRVDIAILSALQRNGRSTVQSLADRVGLSSRACLERIRRLEAAKIITGYQAIIDIAALSRPINVFAEIILERQARQVGFERRLAKIDNVVECWEVGGTVDYIARFVCPRPRALRGTDEAADRRRRPGRRTNYQPCRAAPGSSIHRLS